MGNLLTVSVAAVRPVLDLEPDAVLRRCAARQALDLVSDKWTPLVVFVLAQRSHRFNELRRRVDGISQKVLSSTLRKLERAGCVQRTVYPTVPATVEYALTPLGSTLIGPLTAVLEWAHANAAGCGFTDGEADATSGELGDEPTTPHR